MMLHSLVRQFPEGWSPRPATYPAECQMAQVRRRIDDEADSREARLALAPIDLEALKRHLQHAAAGGSWDSLSARQWRYASECLTMGSPRLLDNPDFLASFLQNLERSRAFPVACNHLARWYLMTMSPGQAAFTVIAAFLRKHVGTLRTRWRDLHERHLLFCPEQVADRIAADFLSTADSVPAFAAARGYPAAVLPSPLFASALVSAGQATAHAVAAPTLSKLKRLADWAVSEGRPRYSSFPETQAVLAEALLLPWQSRYPGEAIRSFVVRLLIGLLGDPRTKPPAWRTVSQQARNIMLRWMTRDALEQFLDVVDQTVQAHQLRLWGARRAFWLSFDEAQQIRESWVVFGRRGAAVARTIAAGNDQSTLAHFGTLVRDASGDPTQAVLIMRIGSLIVADWSHNGRCHIWLPENPQAPQLYQAEYSREELLVGADFETPHYKDWQDEIKAYISARLCA